MTEAERNRKLQGKIKKMEREFRSLLAMFKKNTTEVIEMLGKEAKHILENEKLLLKIENMEKSIVKNFLRG